LEAPQRSFECAIDVLAPVPSGVGIAVRGVKSKLRRQDHAVAQVALLDEFSDHLFAAPELVAIGGVHEISARFQIAIEDGARVALFVAPSPFGSKRHGSKTEWTDTQPGTSQSDIAIHAEVHALKMIADRRAGSSAPV